LLRGSTAPQTDDVTPSPLSKQRTKTIDRSASKQEDSPPDRGNRGIMSEEPGMTEGPEREKTRKTWEGYEGKMKEQGRSEENCWIKI